MPKLWKIFFNIIPVVLMIGLIPYVPNDHVLAAFYLLIIGLALMYKHEKNDYLALMVGIVGMTISEYFFIQTGVETFTRNSLFGIMPLWLPLLWGYGFIVIKRITAILA